MITSMAGQKGFPVIYVHVFAYLGLSLIGFSPSHVRVYAAGPGFILCVVVYICMDPLGG